MNPDATNTPQPLEALEHLETYLHGSAPPPFTSNRQLFLDAMKRRRVADAAGDVALRDLLQSQAASHYDYAVFEVNSPDPAVAPSTPIVLPLPVSLGEQLARTNAAAGSATPPRSHAAAASNHVPAPASTTNQEMLDRAIAAAAAITPGFTLTGIGVPDSAIASLVSRAPGLRPLASTYSPTSAGHAPVVVAGSVGNGPRPLPVSLRDRLAGAGAHATEVRPAHGSLTPDQIGVLRDVPPAERANLPPELRDHGYLTSGSAPTASQASSFVGSVPLAVAATGPSEAGPIGPALPLPPSLRDHLSGGAHIQAAGMSTIPTKSGAAMANADLVAHLTPLLRDAAARIDAARTKLTEAGHDLQAALNNFVHLARVVSEASTQTRAAGTHVDSPTRMAAPK